MITHDMLDLTQRRFIRHLHAHSVPVEHIAKRLHLPLDVVCQACNVPVPEPPPPSPAELAEEIAGKAARLAEALAPPVPAAEPVVPAPVDPPPLEPPPPLAALAPGELGPGRHVIDGRVTIIPNPRHVLRIL